MIKKIYNDNTNQRDIEKVVEILKSGGVVIFPTDTVYGIGCDIHNHKAVEKVAKIKGVKLEQANFSFIFNDLSQISEYTGPIDNPTFKLLKKHLPGPFTFILNAGGKVPKVFMNKKKTIGIRIPDNNIIRGVVGELGNPILTTSVKDNDEIIEYTTDPELIHEQFGCLVDLVIDGGYGQNEASTVVDCTNSVPIIVRQGIGEIDL
jgi:tRNA threonylcarbamoyl adenosine modification protein (Sua5/YciO/YrdC/YwlC family)